MSDEGKLAKLLMEPQRRCGTCTLCCTLLPVITLKKEAGVRCQHARGLGCNIYHKPGFPGECGMWNCRWVINDDMDDMLRPDQAHYCIDIVPDFVTVQQPGKSDLRIPVFQIWCDPRFPDAHRDPKLRAWILRQPGWLALVRYNAADAVTLIPPNMSDTADWEEIRGNRTQISDDTHRAHETAAVIAQHEQGTRQ
jgi:hypothetical protein